MQTRAAHPNGKIEYPPPHDREEREWVADAGGGWSYWRHPVHGSLYSYFDAKGFAHLQLFHPVSGCSILTPSRLTGTTFEVYPIGYWKAHAHCYATLESLIRRRYGIKIPSHASMRAAVRWYLPAPRTGRTCEERHATFGDLG